jgi:hypothetical protein
MVRARRLRRYLGKSGFVGLRLPNERDAIPFALPGAELGPHDDQGSTFRKFLAKYDLGDPALHTMADVVEAGIDYVLHGVQPAGVGHAAIGLLAISEGTMPLEDDDAAIIARSLAIYDALYAYFTAHRLAADRGEPLPAHEGLGPTRPTRYLRELLARRADDGIR